MELNVLDVEQFVSINKLEKVTDPIYFSAGGRATEDGLFSTRIFGRIGSEDRRRRWGYIDLGQWYVHPMVYKTLCQIKHGFPGVVTGEEYLEVSRTGELISSTEEAGGWTGIDALRDRWPSIKWAVGGARSHSQRWERLQLLSSVPRDLAFVRKWPVMPALYRDVELGDAASRVLEVPPINQLYSRLMTIAPPSMTGLRFTDGLRRVRAQDMLLEAYQSTLSTIARKEGIIQDTLLGKYVDWAVRGVISSPSLATARHPGEQEVPFGSIGIPLYMVINLFQPFIMKFISERLKVISNGQEVVLAARVDDDPSITDPKLRRLRNVEIPTEVRGLLTADLYRKWVAQYMRSQANRTDPLAVKLSDGTEFEIPLFDHLLPWKTTITDLFYIAAMEVVKDKHVMVTRYPVEDFRAAHFTRVTVLTTARTAPLTVDETLFPRYPVLDGKHRWVDSIRINNSYCPGMGADFDGDTVRMVGIFTQEANAEAERLIDSPVNFCDGEGAPSRTLANEGVITLYALTQ